MSATREQGAEKSEQGGDGDDESFVSPPPPPFAPSLSLAPLPEPTKISSSSPSPSLFSSNKEEEVTELKTRQSPFGFLDPFEVLKNVESDLDNSSPLELPKREMNNFQVLPEGLEMMRGVPSREPSTSSKSKGNKKKKTTGVRPSDEPSIGVMGDSRKVTPFAAIATGTSFDMITPIALDTPFILDTTHSTKYDRTDSAIISPISLFKSSLVYSPALRMGTWSNGICYATRKNLRVIDRESGARILLKAHQVGIVQLGIGTLRGTGREGRWIASVDESGRLIVFCVPEKFSNEQEAL